jgi:hypothetical protein
LFSCFSRALTRNSENMMFKSLVALAILSVASAPVLAQTVPGTQAPQAKPQTVKKRVCQTIDEDSYSRLGNRKICRTIEVPAPAAGGQNGQAAPVSASPNERG